jgi:hypothetical protein
MSDEKTYLVLQSDFDIHAYTPNEMDDIMSKNDNAFFNLLQVDNNGHIIVKMEQLTRDSVWEIDS